jgi:LPXTG-motif cell wall-anchored protein
VLSTRRFAAPIAALILALTPTAALAQSAGDDQYTDPFGESDPSQASGGSGGGSGGSDATPGTSSGSAAQGSGSAAPSASAAGGELPRTGLDAGVVAAIGAGLVGMGLVLRRRTADARR